MLSRGDEGCVSKIPEAVPLVEIVHPTVVGVVIDAVVFDADMILRVSDIHFEGAASSDIVEYFIIHLRVGQPICVRAKSYDRFLR